MKYLLDTHLLLWTTGETYRLPKAALPLLNDPGNELVFSTASMWEIAIKKSLGREDFRRDLHVMRRGLREACYQELPITTDHALGVMALPRIHKDPFDRLLVAQAIAEGITLLTVDSELVRYPCPVRIV